MKNFIYYWLFMVFVLYSALALDFYSNNPTNAVIFFLSTVFIPLSLAFIGLGGKESITNFMGFSKSLLFNIAEFLLGLGIMAIVVTLILNPWQQSLVGTPLYKSSLILDFPLERNTLSTPPPMYSGIFYLWVAIGEETLKLFGAMAVYYLVKKKVGGNLATLFGFLASLAAWLGLHVFAWGSAGIFGLPMFGMGYLLSTIFYIGYWMVGLLFTKSVSRVFKSMNILAPIAGHFYYDFFISMQSGGLNISPFIGLGFGIGAMIIGAGIIGVEFYRVKIKHSLREEDVLPLQQLDHMEAGYA